VARAGNLFPALARGNLIILASVVARRQLVLDAGGFDETLPVCACEDWDLWLRLSRRHPVTVVDDELTYYRHPGSSSAAQLLEGGLAVIERRYAEAGTAEAAGLSRAAARARLRWYLAGAVAAERRVAAVPLLLAALREDPGTALARPALGALAAPFFSRAPPARCAAAGMSAALRRGAFGPSW
jgi:hypothetical protein